MITTFLLNSGGELKKNVSRAEMLAGLKDKDAMLWIDLENPTDFEAECLVEIFNFHPLAVEDCLTDHSQPKIDDYDEYLFMVFHSVIMTRDEEEELDELDTIELEVFLGKNYVVTFHKTPVKTIHQVRDGVLKKPQYYLGQGSDILFHSILDRLVDNYQPVIDLYDHKIDKLEDDMFEEDTDEDFLPTLIQTKRDIFNFRRFVAPQRDVVNFLTRTPNPFIRSSHMMYFRDIYDHLVRIYGIAEGYHETLSSILQAFFSYSSHKLNEVVKHMTVLATLTMPSIIVASIYGMNFKHLPGLDWPYGSLGAIGIMIAISGTMLIWMKIKKWI